MTEAWKESLKRIKRGEQRERELRELRDKPWPRYPLFSSAEPHMPAIGLDPTIRNLGTVIRDAAKLYATLLEATQDSKGAQHVRVTREELFDVLRMPYNEEE